MSFATKLSHIEYSDGTKRDVMKRPKTDATKVSLPGEVAVKRVDGVPTVFPRELVAPEDDMLEVVYDGGPVEGYVWETFDATRERVAREWPTLPLVFDPVSAELRAKMAAIVADDSEGKLA